MKNLSVHLIVFLLLNILGESLCQVKFASGYLKDMFETLPSDCKNILNVSSASNNFSIKTNNIIKSRYVTINYYITKNILEDLGVTVFDSSSRMLLEYEILCRFVERKILELLLIAGDNSLIEKLKEENINVLLDNYPILSCNMLDDAYLIMTDQSDLKLRRDSLRYELTWVNSNNKEVVFLFPATNTLIRAKDKKELDDEIIDQLKNFRYAWTNEEKSNLDNISISELKSDDSIYFTNGKIFYINEINDNKYFILENEKLHYVFEPDYLSESLCNLIQNPFLSINKYIQLKHRVYGYNEVSYTLKLSDFIAYFKNNCIFYTGIEQQTEDGIKAVVIVQNSFLNFIHLLVLDLNKSDLFDPDKSLSASFHTNIPTDNIQNLFEDYEPQKKLFKLKI